MWEIKNRCLNCMGTIPSGTVICPFCGRDGRSLPGVPGQLPPGTILAGKYLTGRSIGRGSFGITYLGWDLQRERRLAIKEYFPRGFAHREEGTQVFAEEKAPADVFVSGVESFLREGKKQVQFSGDPGIVRVEDAFPENGTAYLVMEYLEGKSLRELAEEQGGRLPLREVMGYVLPLMDSLAVFHREGLLHRDIRPENIRLRPDGRAVLLDFGASRQVSAGADSDNTVNVAKHGFAPVEQYQIHGRQGPWTDIYALCATIYNLTTGVRPPLANDRVALNAPLPRPGKLCEEYTPELESAVLRGMALRGSDRPADMRELKKLFLPVSPEEREKKEREETRRREELTRRRQELEERRKKNRRRLKRARIVNAGLALLLVVVVGLLFTTRDLWPERSPRTEEKMPAEAPVLGKAESAPGGVRITWSAVTGVRRYALWRRQGSGSWEKYALVTGTAYLDRYAVSGQEYSYTVSALSDEGAILSDYDPEGLSLWYVALPMIQTLEDVSDGVRLSWEPVGGAAGYAVWRKGPGEENWTQCTVLTDTAFLDTNVEGGQSYSYLIQALDEAGEALTSSDAGARTILYAQIPRLTGIENAWNGIRVTWETVDGAEKYLVWRRGPGDEDWVKYGITGDGEFLDRKTESACTYAYTVQGLDARDNSLNEKDPQGLSITYVAPAVLQSVAGVSGGVRLEWSAVPGAAQYAVLRKIPGEEWSEYALTEQTFYTDWEVEAGASYTYTVLSCDGEGTYLSGYDPTGSTIHVTADNG